MRLLTLLMIAFIVALTPKSHADPLPLTLEKTLQHVYQHHPALESARHEFKALAEDYPQALAGWRPRLSAEATLYATDVDNSNFGMATGATTKDFFINLEQPIFRGGRTIAETSAAKYIVRAGWEGLRQREQSVLMDTIRAYMDVHRAKSLYDLRIENVTLVADELESTRARQRGGELTQTDVYEAEARLATVQSAKLRAQADYDNSRTVFERIAGFYPSDKLAAPSADFTTFHDMPENLDAALVRIYDQNPQLRAAVFRHQAAKDFKNAAYRELYPNLFAFASFNKQYDPQPGIIDETDVQTVGLRLSVPLYNGGATRSRIRESHHVINQRATELTDLKRAVQNSFVANWRRHLTAVSEIQLREQQEKAADMARVGVAESALLGERSVLDLLDAEQDYIEARSAYIRAYYDRQLSQFDMLADLGELTPALFGSAPNIESAEDYLDEIGGLFFTTKIK